jgi:hypothetical protein
MIGKYPTLTEKIIMAFDGAIIVAVVLLLIGVFLWGGLTTRRSIAVALLTLMVSVLAVGCGYYAFAESHSLPWAIGYGAIALTSLIVSISHLTRIGRVEDVIE